MNDVHRAASPPKLRPPLTGWIVAALVVLTPFPTTASPSLRLRAVDDDGQPIARIEISRRSQSYGLRGSGTVTTISDERGYVEFSQRLAWGSIGARFIGHMLTTINPHASYGTHSRVEVSVPRSHRMKFDFDSHSATLRSGVDEFPTFRDDTGRTYFTNDRGRTIVIDGDLPSSSVIELRLSSR